MKTIIRLSIIGLVLAALVGCYAAADGSGDLGIILPDPRFSEGSQEAEFARVYILLEPNLIPVGDGTDYAEFELQDQNGEPQSSVSVTVPSGSGYRAILVLGSKEPAADSGQAFVPTHYAVSEVFSIGPGPAEPLDVDLKASPFVPVDPSNTLGRDLLGVVATSSDVYVATSSQVYVANGGSPDGFDGGLNFGAANSLRAGEQIVSISRSAVNGADVMMANTNLGVLPYNGTNALGTFDVNLPDDAGLPILDSGGITVGGTSYGYLEFAGGITGYRANAVSPGAGDWMSPADLGEIVTGESIYDMDVSQAGGAFFGYFATKLGAFRMVLNENSPLTGETLIELPGDAGVDEIFEGYTNFFGVRINDNPAVITQLAMDRTSPSKIYVGTRRGAVIIDESQIPDFPSEVGETETILNPTVIAGTENQEVLDMFVDGSLVAILTDHFLTVSTDGGTSFKSIPVYASSAAGTISDMLVSSGTPDVVLLSGSEGLAGVDIANIE